MQRGKNQQQALSLLLRNYAELHLHKMTWYLAEEYHQKYTSDTSCSKNDKECSPWVTCYVSLISKQEINNDITEQQATTTNTFI